MRALEKKIYDYLEAHREDIVADLAALARAESPTGDKAAADACARLLASLYKDRLGAATQFVPQTEVGDHLVTEIGSGDRTLLIVGHYDTVHPLGTVPVHREGDVLYGPGVVDMKGGDISVIWALKALQELGVKLDKKVLIVNNSDEETGSFHSRPLLLEKAKEAYACIVAEPAVAKSGLIKVSRKGGGQILIKCWGKAAHSGNDPRGGVNANIELAHQILFAESRSDYGPGGSTFSANVIRGGTADNVVCDYAEAGPCCPARAWSSRSNCLTRRWPSARPTESSSRCFSRSAPTLTWNSRRRPWWAAARTATTFPPPACPPSTAWAWSATSCTTRRSRSISTSSCPAWP